MNNMDQNSKIIESREKNFRKMATGIKLAQTHR